MSNQITETTNSKKRIYQFIGFTEYEFKDLIPLFQEKDKSLLLNDKWHIEVESHDTVEIIKLIKHKAREYEKR